MKIVAFLQNPWFKPGTAEHHIEMYRDNQQFHQRVLLCCMTGQRLQKAFGDLYRQIHWDNTNWRPAWYAAGKTPADMDHIQYVLVNQKPDLVLTFGRQAEYALNLILVEFETISGLKCPRLLSCHHPNARHQTQKDLDHFADSIRNWINEES